MHLPIIIIEALWGNDASVNWVIIGSVNALGTGQHPTSTWANAELLLIGFR